MDFEKFVTDALKDIQTKQEQIIIQTTKTNGRLLKVEDWQRFINKLLWGVLGSVIAVIGFFVQNYISKL